MSTLTGIALATTLGSDMAGDTETRAAIIRVNAATKSGRQPKAADAEIVSRMAKQASPLGMGLGAAARRAEEGKLGPNELQD